MGDRQIKQTTARAFRRKNSLLLAGVATAALILPATREAHAADTTQSGKTKHKVAHTAKVHRAPVTTTGVRTVRATATTPVAATAPVPVPVKAQTLAQASTDTSGLSVDQEQIVVTGSRLAHKAINDIAPSYSVDAAQLSARGYTNLGTALLREDTAFSSPDNSTAGQQGSFGAGQFFASMLGMGSQRTLTLVNGHRFVSGASSSLFGAVAGSPVDMSTLPVSLVKRVERKTVGGAPAYGSDAIAGVVNYILDDDFQGVKLNAQGGFSQREDYGSAHIAFTAGHHFDHDRGGIVFNLEYTDTLPMTNAQRANSVGNGDDRMSYGQASAADNSPFKYVLRDGSRRYLEFTTTGMPLGIDSYPTLNGQPYASLTNAAGQPLIFSQDGRSLVPLTFKQANGDQLTGVNGNGFPINNYSNLITGQHRLNLTGLNHYQITDHLKLSLEEWYQQSDSFNTAAQGYYNTALFGDAMTGSTTDGTANGDLVLSTNNPFLTAGEQNTIKSALAAQGLPTDSFYMARANQDIGAGYFTTNNQMFRFVGTLAGDFNFAGRHFDWDVTPEYGKNISTTDQPQIVTQNYYNAINAVTAADGSIICAPGYTSAGIATVNPTCSPLNVFGQGQASQDAANYVMARTRTKQINSQFDVLGEVKSTVVKLPAGDIRYAIGYEHRRESFNFNPGAYNLGQLQPDGSRDPWGASAVMTPVVGSYETHEAFGTLSVPLVNPSMQVPGVFNASIEADARYVHNSITGGFWTWTAGGAYSPVRDITFRGNYTRSLRAPAVTELFAPQGTVFDLGDDPCSSQFINTGPNPATRMANCEAAGVPATGFNSNIVNFTQKGVSGGNPHLRNEVADSFTGGFMFTPHFARGLELTADFNDIKLSNEITSLTLGQLMQACYDSATYPNQYCSTFSRGTDHQIQPGFQEGYYNIASRHVQALQAALHYTVSLRRFGLPDDAGLLQGSVNYTHYANNTRTLLGTTYQESGDLGTPNDRFTADLNYVRGPLFFQWQILYYGPSKYALNVSDTTYQHNKVAQWFTFNTTIEYTFAKHWTANFMMNNVFDGRPQYPYQISDSSYDRYMDAIIGRNFQVSLTAAF